jgi:hypothetical protein
MVAVKAGDVEGVLRRPDPKILVYLFYGPDSAPGRSPSVRSMIPPTPSR